MPHGALAMGAAGSGVAPLATPVPAASHSATSNPAAAPPLVDKKAASQRLLNTLVLVVLLIALAIISVLAFRGGQPAAKPELAGSGGQSKDHLDSLSDIRVPEISKPPMQSASTQTAGPESAAGHSVEANTALSSGGLQLSLDKTRSTSGAGTTERPGLTLDAADLAKKPNTGAAQVQLGTPVPMRSSAGSAVASSPENASQPGNSSLPLTTPRYETVSTPSSPGGAPASGSGTASGASPSLWDGAKKPADPQGKPKSDLMLSGANDSEMSLIPSDYSSSSAKPTTAQPVSTKNAAPTSSNVPTASAQSASLGVTVGAGMREPEFPQAKATATPDLDVAAISNKFVEYSRQKSGATAPASTEIVNPYALASHPAAQPATTTAPATTAAANSYVAGAYQQQSPAGAGVPYGTTGATMTPYVRNTPTGAAASGLGGGSMQSAYPTGNQNSASMSGPSASTVYPSLSGASGYPQTSAANSSTGYNAGYTAQSTSGNGFAIPPRGSVTTSPQMTAGAAGAATAPAPTGANGYSAAQNFGAQNYGTQSYGYAAGAAGATAPAAGAAYQSAPVSNSPYPGGQAPQGMIGQSGFATAPSGDVAPPMPVTGKIGYGASPTR